MKRYIEFLKTMWRDEKGKALIKLSFYLIFIVIAVLYTRSLYSDKYYTEPSKKEDEVMSEYVSRKYFTESITVDGILYLLEYGDEVLLSKDKDTYVIDILNNMITLNGKNVAIDFKIPFWNLKPELIKKLINNREEFYITNFSDSSKEKGYKIPLNDFIRIFEDKTNSYEEINQDKNVMLTIHEQDKKIDKVSLDITEYYHSITNEIKDYKIEIKY